jgi:hypothetical protein
MDPPERLPADWRNAQQGSYLGPARFRVTGDPALALPYIQAGRALLGALRYQLSLTGAPHGKWVRFLPDGTRLIVSFDGVVNNIQIDPPPLGKGLPLTLWQPLFLFDEKAFGVDPFRFGYYYDTERTRRERTLPYLPGEPESTPYADKTQFNSITECPYWQKDLAYKLVEGKNTRYGNQRLFKLNGDTPAVYSWWGSPFGDLPHLVFKSIGFLFAANQRYMPAYVTEQKEYLYATEGPYTAWKPPLDVYQNGKTLFVCPGDPSQALIAGVGIAQNGDVLVIRAMTKTLELFYWTRQGDPQPGGFLLGASEIAAHPWRFNADATQVAGIVTLPVEEDKHTLQVVEFDIHYDDQALTYSASERKRTPYTGTYATAVNAQNVYQTTTTPGTPERGQLTSGTNSTSEDSQTSDTTYIKKLTWPVGLYYRDGDLQVATLERVETNHNHYYAAHNTVSKTAAWNNMFTATGYWRYFTEAKNSGLTYDLQTIEQTITTETKLQYPDKKTVELESVTRAYHYHLNNVVNQLSGSYYDGFTETWCPNGGHPPDTLPSWSGTQINYSGNTTDQSSAALDDTHGYDAQLLFLDAANKTLFWIRTDYSVTDDEAFQRSSSYTNRQEVTTTYYGCGPDYSRGETDTADYAASVSATGGKQDQSAATFTAAFPPDEQIAIDDPVTLVDATPPSPHNYSDAEFIHLEAATPGDLAPGSSDPRYPHWLSVSGKTSDIPVPGWVQYGPAIGHTNFNTQYSHADLVTVYTGNTLSQDYCSRYFKGAASFVSDASLVATDVIQSLLAPTLDIGQWIYAANAAGYFIDPTYTWTPGAIYDAGGIFAKRFSSPLDQLIDAFGINDPTVYPIGWSLQRIDNPLQETA